MRRRFLADVVAVGAAVYFFSGACDHPSSSKLLEKKEPPLGDNQLQFFGLQTLDYRNLILKGNVAQVPWPDDYWATRYGGISYRWNVEEENSSEEYQDYIYEFPTFVDLKRMSTYELNGLSPAEKYDIWVGRRNLAEPGSVSAMERQRVNDAAETADGDNIPKWVGICNGWALVAARVAQPMRSFEVKAPWGTPFSFYASDVKALYSVMWDDFQGGAYIQRIGSRCDDDELSGRPDNLECRDISAMSLTVVLSEVIGKQKKSFVVEGDKTSEVWNYPMYSYSLEMGKPIAIPNNYRHAAPGATQLVHVNAKISYVIESDPMYEGQSKDEILGDYLETMDMSYHLEIDRNGIIVGSEWDAGSDHPDFIWRTNDTPNAGNLGADYPISPAKLQELGRLAQ